MRITPDERTDKCNEQLHKLSTVGFYGVLAVTFRELHPDYTFFLVRSDFKFVFF
jgi:hypothetical protein